MSLFAKTGPWVVASLIAATSVFGQNSKSTDKGCSKTCDEMKQMQLMPAYNAPSRIEVRGCWDVYASGSFTYWQAIQENMELGVVVTTPTAPAVTTSGDVVNPSFGYKPGFKVALGMNFDHDNWDSMIQYTWFRGKHATTTTMDRVGFPSTSLHNLWMSPTGAANDFTSGSGNWKLHMDLVDWELARSYYVGTKLTFRPFFAARAAWIRQNIDVDYSSEVDTGRNVDIDKRSHSWAVGPRAGLYSDWMIGDGFRLYGNGAGDILFTQYKKLKSTQAITTAAGVPVSTLVVTQTKLNCLRTHLDLELGLGWGSYFDCNNWHVDLSAGYVFQVFFDQNMFRHFNDDVHIMNSMSPNGNLYMHGLTATARFDF